MLKFVPTILLPFATPLDFSATTNPFHGPAADQLSPTAALGRLRPVKLEATTRLLQQYIWTGNALLLLNQFFPESFKRYPSPSLPIWPEILTHILKTVEVTDQHTFIVTYSVGGTVVRGNRPDRGPTGGKVSNMIIHFVSRFSQR